ncbi:MAG: hypothetical protein V4579_13870 [Pseudomonadota bacterium]
MKRSLKRVLVVENSPLMAMELIELIEESNNVTVHLTSNIEFAIAILNEYSFDGAVVGIQDQFGQWRELADTLSKSAIPWIFVSGHRPDVLGGDYPETPYVEKPFAALQVRSLVEEMLYGTTEVMPVAVRPPGDRTGANILR